MIFIQAAKTGTQISESENIRRTLKKRCLTKAVEKNLEFFYLASRIKLIHQPLAKEAGKYKKIWQRVRLILREKSAKRYFKEIELYENLSRSKMNESLKRMKNFTLEMVPTSAENTLKPWYIIHPKSRFSKFWRYQMIVVMLYIAAVLPYRIAFIDSEDSDSWYYTDNIMNILFISDLIINCFTGYYKDPDNFIASFSLIFSRYFKSWLLIDLFSCIPFDLFLKTSGKNYSNLARLLRLSRLYRLSKLSSIFRYLKSRSKSKSKIEQINLSESHLKMFNFFLTVVLCSHIMTCLFCLAAKLNYSPENSWLSRSPDQDSSLEQYISSMYWTYTTLTTVGYGDISPKSNLELILGIIWMVFGIFFFSFTIGSLASALNEVDSKSTLLTTRLIQIDEFAKDCRISRGLKRQIKEASRYLTEQEGFFCKNKQDIYLELPLKLRHEVALAMHKQAALKIKFFSNRDASFITTVIPLLIPVKLGTGEYVYFKNEVSEEMYFLVKGKVCLIDSSKKVAFANFLEGSYFGDSEIVLKEKRKFSSLCVNPTSLLTLNIEGINIIQEEFEIIWEEFRKVAEQRNFLFQIAVRNAEIVMAYRQSLKYSQMEHEEIKDIYNDLIHTEFQIKILRQVCSEKEDVVNEFCGKSGEYLEDVKKISQSVSMLEKKVKVIERLLNNE